MQDKSSISGLVTDFTDKEHLNQSCKGRIHVCFHIKGKANVYEAAVTGNLETKHQIRMFVRFYELRNVVLQRRRLSLETKSYTNSAEIVGNVMNAPLLPVFTYTHGHTPTCSSSVFSPLQTSSISVCKKTLITPPVSHMPDLRASLATQAC